jgi:hypothetical protein
MNSYLFKFFAVVLILISLKTVIAGERRTQAMGEMNVAVPDIDSRINLYQSAGNMAWLKVNDSLNWMRYGAISENNWGEIRRYWDAERNSVNYFSFSGQKHISNSQVFFGEIRYAWDTRFNMNQAIERSPYAADPFVLSDSTSGNIDFYGPQVIVGFSHQLTDHLFWGASLKYAISNGLKKKFTSPEILSREIQASLDLAYRFNSHWTVGILIRPYQNLDYTKLVNQPDGSTPVTYRYRGEFEFRKSVSASDRDATSEGYETGPQIQFTSQRLESVFDAKYYYQWLKIFDGAGGSRHHNDGSYQAKKYSVSWTGRLFAYNLKSTAISWNYRFDYLDDWAQEPNYNLMFYRSNIREHQLLIGFSHQLKAVPVLLAGEWSYNLVNPEKNDYLAHVFRKGDITDSKLHLGVEFNYAQPFQVRAGYIYQWYNEDPIWDYFGDYKGPAVTFGFGIIESNLEFNVCGKIGRVMKISESTTNTTARREQLDLVLELKTYF